METYDFFGSRLRGVVVSSLVVKLFLLLLLGTRTPSVDFAKNTSIRRKKREDDL